ncbi:MAG: sugar ABC transporter substrate-binding protein [Planctomycetota bacterium]|nr:MAG: sugar ABC transporter substrate-binding protein [Planctomycetota bacterium]
MLAALPLTAFSEATATAEPTPGGGAVAAAVGALGSAVGAMAARYAEGRDSAAGQEAELSREIAALDELRRRLLGLIEDDAEAYGAVNVAYAMPKSDAEEKAARRQAIQDALAGAAEPPLRICRACLEALRLLDGHLPRANPQLLSDVGVAAYTLAAAQRSAWLNVLVNLKSLKRAELVSALSDEGRELLQAGAQLERSLSRFVLSSLGA